MRVFAGSVRCSEGDMNLRHHRLAKSASILVVLIFLALTLLALAFGCGRGRGAASGGAISQVGAGASGDATGGIGMPSPESNSARTLSLEQVVAEIEAYEPAGDASAQMNWHVFAQLKYELIRQLEEIATSRGVSSFPIRNRISNPVQHPIDSVQRPIDSVQRPVLGAPSNARDASQSGGGAQITIGDIFVTPTMNGENAITW